MTKEMKGSWKALNQYLERNTLTGEVRLIETKDIIPNLRYSNDTGLKNYAVTKFEKRSIPQTKPTTTPPTATVDDTVDYSDDKEYWQIVDGFDGRYMVSTWGRVWSNYGKGRYMALQDNGFGYLQVELSKGDGCKNVRVRVHRLVAKAFIPNPENKPEIDHIDGNSRNNHVTNLRWCTHAENIGYSDKVGAHMKTPEHKARVAELNSKPVLRKHPDTMEVLERFSSTRDANRKGWNSSNVSAACRGCNYTKGHIYKGFYWEYE